MNVRDQRKQLSRQSLLDAALRLSLQHHAFGNVSLREVTRFAGMAPAAFYRHFTDMEQLGGDLAEQVSICLHRLRRRLQDSYAAPEVSTRHSIEQFFLQVDQEPDYWRFLIQERWGASATARQIIDRELRLFAQDLGRDIAALPPYQHFRNTDLQFVADLVLSLSVAWIMQWLNLAGLPQPQRDQQRQAHIEHATQQMHLLFRGIAHWEEDAPGIPVRAEPVLMP